MKNYPDEDLYHIEGTLRQTYKKFTKGAMSFF